MSEKIYLLIIKLGVYAVLFTPLIVSTKFFFPFVSPKTIFFRIIIEVILAAYIFLAISHARYRPRITPITLAVLLFLEVLIFTSLTGINFTRSFWSTYERMTGLWTMLHLYAFFIVLFSCFKKKKEWAKILGVSVLVGVILSLYLLFGNEASTRGGGTIGNTSFMAAYLLFDIFFALILIFSNFLKKSGWPLFWQIFSGISLLIMMPVFLNSTARGAIFSFWVGIILMGWGYLLFSRKKRFKQLALAIALLCLILGSILIFYQPDFLKNEANFTLSEMKSRLTVWHIALASWQDKPWLGWGPENFHVPFTKHFNPCMFSSCGGEIWFDRVHNVVLDTLVTTGLVGLLSYLAIFGAVFWRVGHVLKKITEPREMIAPLGIAALLIAYFVQNLLVFDMINTYLVFFLSLAFVGFITSNHKEVEVKERRLNPFLASLILVILIPMLWFGNIQPAIAGFYLFKMLSTPIQDLPKVTDDFQKSLDSWMNKYETRELFPQKLSQISFPVRDKESLFKALALAEQEMEKSVKENPLDFRHHLFLSKLYRFSYQTTGKLEKLQLAEKYAEESLALAPAAQQGYWALADIKLIRGRSAEAVGLFKKAIDLEPGYNVSHLYLVSVYKLLGQNQLAQREILEMQRLGLISASEAADFLKTAPQ